jgi:hypothetical protein
MGTAPSDSVHTDDEGHLVLRGELFWKWKAIHEAVQRCDAEVRARTPVIDAILEQHPELKKLLGERAAYIQQRMTMNAEYKNVLAQLEAHFGFSMQNVSIDDLTGRVHRHDLASPDVSTDTPPPAVTNGVNGHAIKPPTSPSKSSGKTAKKTTKKPLKKR